MEETRYMTVKDSVKEYFLEYAGEFPEEYDGHYKATYELQDSIFKFIDEQEEYLNSKL